MKHITAIIIPILRIHTFTLAVELANTSYKLQLQSDKAAFVALLVSPELIVNNTRLMTLWFSNETVVSWKCIYHTAISWAVTKT